MDSDLGNLKHKNSALLVKSGWNLVRGEESLWILVMKAKYLRMRSFFSCEEKRGDSMV